VPNTRPATATLREEHLAGRCIMTCNKESKRIRAHYKTTDARKRRTAISNTTPRALRDPTSSPKMRISDR